MTERVAVVIGKEIIVEPVAIAADAKSPMATAIHKAFKVKAEEEQKAEEAQALQPQKRHRAKDKKPRVLWSEEEYIKVAKEMLRQNPYAGYLISELSGLEKEAVYAAQREVIDPSRRRKFTDMNRLRVQLLKAFRAIREGLKEEPEKINPSASAEFEEAKEPEIKVAEVVEVVAAKAVEVVKPEPIAAPVLDVDQVVLAMSSKITHGIADMATPLLASLLGGVVKSLIPEITKSLLPSLTETISKQVAEAIAVYDMQKPTAAPVVVATPLGEVQIMQQAQLSPAATPKEFVKVELPAEVVKPRKPKIYLVGPRGKQKNEFEKAYPEYELHFIEHGHGVREAGRSCDLVVASIKHLPPSLRQSLKAHIPADRLRYADSPGTTMRNQIDIWKESQK